MQLKRLFKEDADGHLLDEAGQVLTKKMVVLMGSDNKPVVDGRGMPLVEAKFTDPAGKASVPVMTGVTVIRASKVGADIHFTPTFIAKAVADGWGSFAKGKLTIHASGGDVVYIVTQTPGHYCSYCKVELDSEVNARLHVQSHDGPSPDRNNPSGYGLQNYFNCVKES